MLDCIIAGDSIAVGLHDFKTECVLIGRPGIHSNQFNNMYPQQLDADTVILSISTNDHIGVDSAWELARLRLRVHARRVIWIRPAGNLPGNRVPISRSQDAVALIAAQYGDIVVTIPSTQADGIHPSWTAYCSMINRIEPAAPKVKPTVHEAWCVAR